jgi:hypothetical protein
MEAAMAAYSKFQDFVEQVLKAKHDFSSHTFKVMLTNVAPVATNTIKADLTEITAQNGYTAGGTASSMSLSETGGTAKVTAADVTFTASGGSFGPFRYVVIYNDTQTSPADALIAYYDYGSSITLNDGESFTTDFDGTNGFFQLA